MESCELSQKVEQEGTKRHSQRPAFMLKQTQKETEMNLADVPIGLAMGTIAFCCPIIVPHAFGGFVCAYFASASTRQRISIALGMFLLSDVQCRSVYFVMTVNEVTTHAPKHFSALCSKTVSALFSPSSRKRFSPQRLFHQGEEEQDRKKESTVCTWK